MGVSLGGCNPFMDVAEVVPIRGQVALFCLMVSLWVLVSKKKQKGRSWGKRQAAIP